MTFDTMILFLLAIFVAFLAILLLKRRSKAENTEPSASAPMEQKSAMTVPKEIEGGAYSYGSIIMDEVLEEKIIEGLKESLRMTEEMYKKLSEQFKDDRDRRIELANDWLNYLEALDNIKQARIDYRMNASDGESARIEKESVRIKLEIENKFKNLQNPPRSVPMPPAEI